jgi:hypothetical protein
MRKQSINHVAKLLAGTSVVVVSSLLAVSSASTRTPDATVLHERTTGDVILSSVCEGTCCRVVVTPPLDDGKTLNI